MHGTSLIVIGSLNTDIVARGVKKFPHPGEHVYGQELVIGPGGKSRNIAAMAGRLSLPDQVAMIGRTAEDKYGLWKPPMDALQVAGVNTDYIQVVSLTTAHKLPAVALIPVNEQGENQIILLPGVSDDFSDEDIDAAQELYNSVSHNKGYLALTLECPLSTAQYAINKAKDMNIKVIFDPGGIEEDDDVRGLLADMYVVKPNEHEAKMLTGIAVTNFDSARLAAQKLQQQGALNVFITHGEHGAYLFTETEELHIPIPKVSGGSIKDATGCGDQTTATLCVALQQGKALGEAARLAVLSGTLQFYKPGIQPLTQQELMAQL